MEHALRVSSTLIPDPVPSTDPPAWTLLDYDERIEAGKRSRSHTRRSAHSEWAPWHGRRDPIDVLETQAGRLAGLGATWSDVTAVDIYTPHPIHSLLGSAILPRMGPAAVHGAHWFLSRPPIEGLEFEMDMRGVRREIRIGR